MEKQLFIQKADDSGNYIIKPVPGQVICEFDPIPEAKEYAEKFVNLYNQFPNDFGNWQETHFEIVSEITRIARLDDDEKFGEVKETQEANGWSGLYELALVLTNEFEEMNRGRFWDGEFWEEVEDFCRLKLEEKALLTDEQLTNILVTAFEGGINYWCGSVVIDELFTHPKKRASEVIPEGGTLILSDLESPETWKLNKAKLNSGIRQFCINNQTTPSEMYENHDASDADCIIQYALFKELVFG